MTEREGETEMVDRGRRVLRGVGVGIEPEKRSPLEPLTVEAGKLSRRRRYTERKVPGLRGGRGRDRTGFESVTIVS